MSVSVDFAKMEKLRQLEATLELLQNPESYQQLLGEVKTALIRMDAATKKYATVEAAEKFLADARNTLAKAKEQAAAMDAEIKDKAAAMDTKVRVTTAEINDLLARATRDREMAAEKLAKAEAAAAALANDRQVFEQERARALRDIRVTESNLTKKMAIIDQKMAAFKELVG